MQTFKETFEAYGADYASTIQSRFMGNETMYLRFLDMLFEDVNLKKLGGALDRGDMNAAFEAAHTLKGVTGNLGLTPLYNAVCALVEPLRRQDACGEYDALYQVVCVEFDQADKLRAALGEGARA